MSNKLIIRPIALFFFCIGGHHSWASGRVSHGFAIDNANYFAAFYRLHEEANKNQKAAESRKYSEELESIVSKVMGNDVSLEDKSKFGQTVIVKLEIPHKSLKPLATSLANSEDGIGREFSRIYFSLLKKRYIPPVIEPRFVSEIGKISKICEFQKNILAKGVANLTAKTLAKPVIKGFIEDMFPNAFEQPGVKFDLVIDSVINVFLKLQPDVGLMTNCNDLAEDLLNAVRPYCTPSNFDDFEAVDIDSNECTAINVNLAQEIFEFGSLADDSLVKLVTLIDSDKEETSYVKAPLDMSVLLDSAVPFVGFSSVDERTRFKFLLSVAIGNDNEVPYFIKTYREILLFNEEFGRLKKINSLLNFAPEDISLFTHNGGTNSKMSQSQKLFASSINNDGLVIGENLTIPKREPYGSGLHHHIAGAYTSYFLRNMGRSSKDAIWAGFIAGAAYELKDLLGHLYYDYSGTFQVAKKMLTTLTPRQQKMIGFKEDVHEFDFVKLESDFQKIYPIKKNPDIKGKYPDLDEAYFYLSKAARMQKASLTNFEVDSRAHLIGGQLGVQIFQLTQKRELLEPID